MKGVLELKNRITMSRAPSARPVKQSTKYKKKRKKKGIPIVVTGLNHCVL